MQVFHAIPALRSFLAPHRAAGHSIGFVPTMGGLHEGHLSLLRRARAECEVAVVSVFVNPTQFGPTEDLARYPRDIEGDARLCASVGAHALFAPDPAEIYPHGFCTWVDQDDATARRLEGEHRPTHFRGVLTVCLKLFHIVQPDRSYFGQKDYQQALLVRRMARQLDLPMDLVVCPIVREPGGLAMSSRNRYLDPAARQQAASLFRGLETARAALAAGQRSAEALAALIRDELLAAGPCDIDYVAIADPDTLAPVETVDRPAVALLAVRIAGTRLIDNLVLTPPQP
ncbi:MAG TPA: pantoate--beta-alanine ligase [Planctomycetota bacterium]|nr:pantoate--beta-alanine ligase [Planctomycetota bacterium]